MMDFNNRQWLNYMMKHPVDGFENMRWKKAGSVKYAIVIILFWFLASIFENRLYGFQFRAEPDKIFNIIPHFVRTILLFLTWTAGNWAVCTLLDGKGTMKQIFIYSAYAMLPYVISIYAEIMLSHILIREEQIVIDMIHLTGISWTALLLFSAVRTMHQYTFRKTLSAICLTVFTMLIILCLLVLLLVLFQQIYNFIFAIYTEIAYRLKV